MTTKNWTNNPGLDHHYVDTTGFKYQVVLTRILKSDSKTQVEKYTLLVRPPPPPPSPH